MVNGILLDKYYEACAAKCKLYIFFYAVVERFQDRMGEEFTKFTDRVRQAPEDEPGPSRRRPPAPSSQRPQRIPLKKKPRHVPRPSQTRNPSEPGTSSTLSAERQRQRNRDRKKRILKEKGKK